MTTKERISALESQLDEIGAKKQVLIDRINIKSPALKDDLTELNMWNKITIDIQKELIKLMKEEMERGVKEIFEK